MNRNLLPIALALLVLPLVGLGLTQTPATDARVVAGVCEVRVRDGGVQRWQVVDPSFCAGVAPSPSATAPPATVAPTATATALPPTATPVAGDCAAAHAAIVTTGPDGNQWPTWHPSVVGACAFGHEHGADPRTSLADRSMPAFGYVGSLAGDVEPHVGFKVFVGNAGPDSNFSYRLVFHMGTSGVGRYVTRFHSAEYDYLGPLGEVHVSGMADTGVPVGSTCSVPRQGGRDFSTVGCADSYEIWSFRLKIQALDDEYQGPQQSTFWLEGAVAAFDPVTTRNPQDNTQVVYTRTYRVGDGGDPLGTDSPYRGCKREAYGGPIYISNLGGPTAYQTDPYGVVVAGGNLAQYVSAVRGESGSYKVEGDQCAGGVHAPN